MNDRLVAALAIFAGKTERLNVSLIDILARTAHTQFGLQREDIVPSADEVDAYLIDNAGYVRGDDGEVSRPAFVTAPETYGDRNSPEAQAALSSDAPAPANPAPLSTADRAPAEMSAPLPTGEPAPPVVPPADPRPDLSPAPINAPPAADMDAALTQSGGIHTSSLG